MISEETVKHIAKLAKLSLTPEEEERFQKELGDILDYINILDKLDTRDVVPTSQVTGLKNVFREDRIAESLTQDESLSGTKSKHRDYFKTASILSRG